MPAQAPKIDPRTYDDIVRQTSTLVQKYTAWRPRDGQPDAGTALVGIFGRLVEGVIERLNQAPEKNFLAFLDLIGTQIRPPRPARVPLTFQLATGSPVDALVPARTQVAAPPAAGEEEDIVFETDRDLVVTRSQLVAVFAHEPTEDRYTDVTPLATGVSDAAFPAFTGTTLVEHSLYLARDDFFTLPGPKTVTVTITSPGADPLSKLAMAWEYSDGTTWRKLSVNAAVRGNQWQVTIVDVPALVPQTLSGVAGVTAGWLRARLEAPLPPGTAAPPNITRIATSVQVVRNGLAPVQAFATGVLLDLSKDFYPFGEQPRLNDAFYLALPEASAKPGAIVTVNLGLSNPLPVPLQPSNDLAITWEVWDGAAWRVTPVRESVAGVARLTASGSVTLTLPNTVAQRTVNGETGYWLRARMAAGNYGTPVTSEVTISETAGPEKKTRVEVHMKGGYGPPSLASLTLDSTATQSGPLAACFTYNAFTCVDRTDAAQTGASPFPPFTPSTETQPALYIGFDQPFDNRPMTLYTWVDPPCPGTIAEAVRQATPALPPRVRWEYGSATGWRLLGAADETDTFAESGVIRFIGPTDLAARSEFGQQRYWLRARWEDGTFLVPPRLRRVLTNTTWATQATTIENELLGSGTGEPNQVFRTTQAPVLLGQHLEVREFDLPPASEQAAIMAREGADALTVIRDEAGQPEEIWVRWQAVPDFYGSGPQDRHYVLDSLTGEIRFGDEQHGLAPPPGRNNIRMALYRTSNGAKGNRPAATITQLKTTVPYIESVTNHEAADGGADQESLEWVKERGPKMLRHGGRAVTVQDIEDLTYEAAPEVARAQALAPAYDPITLEWLPTFHLPLTQAGEIKVEAQWEGEATLAIAISGPGRGTPYRQQEGKSPQTLTYAVIPGQVVAGDMWRVTFVNRTADAVRTGRVSITYPVGSLDTSLDVPAQAAYAPVSQIRQGGQVELIIVPRRPVAQPTPSLALLSRVREYILARCSPTLTLQVTEPDWVEVTVTAQVVPMSVESADALQASVVTALERFLHPLTGGFEGRGWPFGRRPHLSDLYAVLESVPGVAYVRSLSVRNVPSLADIDPPQPGEIAEDDVTLSNRLARERRDRFLIFSGRHNISVVA